MRYNMKYMSELSIEERSAGGSKPENAGAGYRERA